MMSLDAIHLQSFPENGPANNTISSIDSLADIDYSRLRLLCSLFHCRACRPNAVDRIHNPLVGFLPQIPCCVHFALKSNWPKQLPVTLLPLVGGYVLDHVEESFLTSTPDPSWSICQCKIIKSNGRWDLMLEVKSNSQFDNLTRVLNSSSFESNENNKRKILNTIFEDQPMDHDHSSEKKNQMVTELNDYKVLSDTHLDDQMTEILMRDSILQSSKHILNQKQDVFLASCYPESSKSRSNSFFLTRENPHILGDEIHKKSMFNKHMILGKVKCNRANSNFTLFDFGTTLQTFLDKKTRWQKTKRILRESGVVLISRFFECSGSPIKIKVLFPHQEFSSFLTSSHVTSSWSFSSIKSRVLNLFVSKSKIFDQFQSEQKHKESNTQEITSDTVIVDETKQDPYKLAIKSNLLSLLSPIAPSCLSPTEFYSHVETPDQQVEVFENLRPVFNSRMNAYVICFDNFRVKDKSHTNFKLVRLNDGQKKTILQFGKTENDDEFIMDFQYPLSPLLAFQICISVMNENVCDWVK